MKRKIEIDVDGVLANLLDNDELKIMLADAYPGYTEDCILEYDFANIHASHPIAAQIIRNSFSDADYMRNLPAYEGVVEGFEILSTVPEIDVCIHTLVTGGYDVIKARKEWIEEIKPNNFRYQIDHMNKTMFNDSFIVVEDSPENLERSNATHKILIAHGYNKKYANEHPEIHVVNNFYEATAIIEKLILA
jgi:5'(3')-deoxyribonucleotidase